LALKISQLLWGLWGDLFNLPVYFVAFTIHSTKHYVRHRGQGKLFAARYVATVRLYRKDLKIPLSINFKVIKKNHKNGFATNFNGVRQNKRF